MSREIQAGSSSNVAPLSTTLNAATPPSFVAGVFMIGNFACEWAGPQNGAIPPRVPLASSHVDIAPQLPASWKSTSSLQNNGVLNIGVWGSGPPRDFGSSRYTRHSLPDAAISS